MMTIAELARPTVLTMSDHERLSALVAGRNGQWPDASAILAGNLDRARIMEARGIPSNVVTMNTRVTVQDDSTGKTWMYTLVYPGKEDISIGNLSILTPVGGALIGLSEGETLSWNSRDGRTKELTVVEVLYQPEANGRFDL